MERYQKILLTITILFGALVITHTEPFTGQLSVLIVQLVFFFAARGIWQDEIDKFIKDKFKSKGEK